MKKKTSNFKYILLSCSSIIAVLVIWYVCINVLKLKSETVFPGPVKVFRTFIEKQYTKMPDGLHCRFISGPHKSALLGYGLGLCDWVPLGIAMAWNKWWIVL